MATKPAKSNEELQTDLLMREYVALRTEIVEFVRHYRAHVRSASVILTFTVGIISLAGKADDAFIVSNSRLLWFFIAIVTTTMVSYFAFDALEAQYALFATASRAAVLEDVINEKMGTTLLIWETRLADEYWWKPKSGRHFWWSGESPLKGVGHPSKYLVFYMTVMVLLALFAVPAYSAIRFWFGQHYSHPWLGRLLIASTFVYSMLSFFFIIRTAPTVLWRMKKPARERARHIVESAKSNEDRTTSYRIKELNPRVP
jgi:hypothetical protein